MVSKCNRPEFLGELSQVGIVVRDLQKAMSSYWNVFGIGPWKVYVYEPPFLTDTTVRGKRVRFSMRIAFTWYGNLMLELIEPIEGNSIYKEFLNIRGGVHHLASYTTKDVQAVVNQLTLRGIKTLQTGKFTKDDFSVFFVYMDTEDILGTVIEMVEVKGVRPLPLRTYP